MEVIIKRALENLEIYWKSYEKKADIEKEDYEIENKVLYYNFSLEKMKIGSTWFYRATILKKELVIISF